MGTDEEDAVVAAMVTLHRRHQNARRQQHGEHSAIVRHFERRGERLRAERLVTEEVLDRLFAGGETLPPAREQRELILRGPARGLAAGRLRIANATSERARFEVVCGAVIEGQPELSLRFEPQTGELEPLQKKLIRVEASLARLEPGAVATVPVELRFRLGFDRVWVSVRADIDAEVSS